MDKMFKKSKKRTVMSPGSSTKKDLTILIEKLQRNADKVEKNILETEQNLNKDVVKINKGKPPLYQDSTNKAIESSLLMLDGLDEDTAEAKRLQHPQVQIIEHDMKQLRERVMKLRNEHNHIYHITPFKGFPSVNSIVKEKMATLNIKLFGEDLPTIEKEVEVHNIFHSEVEALAPYIDEGDKDYNRPQIKYNELLTKSTDRRKHLLSLKDFLQRCTNELYWLDQQADERISYDWSDANLDYPARKRQYENYISYCLESKEGAINKLNDVGENLIAQGHPGKNIIEAHMKAVNADWKEYLKLLNCEENHLNNMDKYHKFQMQAKDTQDFLKQLYTDINQKYNPDCKDQYQLEGLLTDLNDQSRAMDFFNDRVKDLQNRSLQVLPLNYRRTAPQKLLPIEALCDFDTDGSQINRGERYTLLRNNGQKWDVKDASSRTMAAPGVCFIIPPTDPDSVAIADNLVNQQNAIKQKLESSKTALQSRLEDLKKDSTDGQDKEELQCCQLMAELDKVVNDLEKQEKAIYFQVRPPLEQNRPVQDSADRIQNMKEISAAVLWIEPEKTTKVHEAETFLKSNPKCASAPQLSAKVDTTVNKYDKIQELLRCTDDRLENSNKLETSIQNCENMLIPYENRLAREEIAPSDPASLDKALRELSDMRSELNSKGSVIPNLESDLRSSKNSCDNMVNRVHEHCPDIDRQEAEVQKLSKRYENLLRQIDTSLETLKANNQKLESSKTAVQSQPADMQKDSTGEQERMVFSSPSKIPQVEGPEFKEIRDQFSLLAYSASDEAVSRRVLQQGVIELAEKVMRKMDRMETEKKMLQKELEKSHCSLNETKKEPDMSKVYLDILSNDTLEVKDKDGDEEKQSGSSMLTVEEKSDE